MLEEEEEEADYAQRRKPRTGCWEPTPSHVLLKHLQEAGKLALCVSQNVDGLEEKAGLTWGMHEVLFCCTFWLRFRDLGVARF
jgi:NAD-dependent SIR2 family protein deacetylase